MKLDKPAMSYNRGLDRDKDGNARRHRRAAEEARSRDCVALSGGYRAIDDAGTQGETEPPRALRGGDWDEHDEADQPLEHERGRRDVGGRFRATDDIVAVIAGNQPAPEPTAAGSSFLIKASDEEGWQPLGETTGGRV